MSKTPYILGIESSCDETAAAIVRGGQELVSSVVASQIKTHQAYGGVVPELASREHLRNISPVVWGALKEAGLGLDAIDAIAVTRGPGLAGALLVGVSYAKALAYASGKPLIAVNHIEGHIHAVLLEQKQSTGGELQFPVLALVVSGGHTHLYLAQRLNETWSYREVGHTRDDAAGEAFDKVAKLLGLPYPGGPIIDRLARFGDAKAVRFTIAQMKHPNRGERAATEPRFDFSYSGIKTAVLRHVELNNMAEEIEVRRRAILRLKSPSPEQVKELCDHHTLDLIASFQNAVVEDLVTKTMLAVREFSVATLLVTGGVAANSLLRERFEQRGAQEGLAVLFPSRPLSTDNAAMIAAAAYPKYMANDFADMHLSAEASLPLR